MQEARLAQHLVRTYSVSNNPGGRGSRLSRWMVDGSSGCLGAEVKEILAAATRVSAAIKVLTDGSSAIWGRRAVTTLV